MPTQAEVINNYIVGLLDHHKTHKPNSILRAGQTKIYLKIQSHVNSMTIMPHLGAIMPRLDVGTLRLLGMTKADD